MVEWTTYDPSEVIGYKTHRDERGNFYRTPLTRGEAYQLWIHIEREEARRFTVH